jgi:hypothetical protein
MVLALAVALVLPACVRMPTGGPVVVRDATAQEDDQPGIYFDPKPPQRGQSASEVVTGFLEAMKAVPIRTSVAARFLSTRAQSEWSPEAHTITYAEASAAEGELEVRVDLAGINRYDASGAWRSRGREQRLTFGLVNEDGDWRIDRLPDGLVVPESWFQDWYRRVSVHYFDPTAQILVPEPVFVPDGEQVATSLVGSLLAERAPRDAAATRSFVPPELAAPRAVTVTPEGVAAVTLEPEDDGSNELPILDDLTTQRVLTQLAWTLRQDDHLRAMRLTVGGADVPLPGGLPEAGLDIGSAYDPNGDLASTDLFGLRGGRLVRGTLADLRPTAGRFGRQRLGLRSVGVSLSGETAAGVTGDGTSLLVAPVEGPDGQAVQVVSDAQDLLPPAWDFSDRVWLVERRGGQARVLVVTGQRRHELRIPGVTGSDVRHFLVSRDGTRFVAVLRGRRGDSVVASRVIRDNGGRVARATAAQPIGTDVDGSGRVRDIGWESPTSVAVLSSITADLSQVRTVPVEGAPGGLIEQGTSRVRGRARALVSSPVDGASAYVVTGTGLTDLTAPERDLSELRVDPVTLTFVG